MLSLYIETCQVTVSIPNDYDPVHMHGSLNRAVSIVNEHNQHDFSGFFQPVNACMERVTTKCLEATVNVAQEAVAMDTRAACVTDRLSRVDHFPHLCATPLQTVCQTDILCYSEILCFQSKRRLHIMMYIAKMI